MRFSTLFSKKLTGGFFNKNGHSDLQTLELSKSLPFQEELHHLYNSIEFILAEIEKKIITVASSTQGEGSSTIAFFYALLVAKQLQQIEDQKAVLKNTINSNRVLLIDANFRHPSVHRFFNLQNGIGFSDLLLNQKIESDVITHIENTNLSVITTGRAAERMIGIKNTKINNAIFENLQQRFAYIIVDAAPILHHADSFVFGQRCDGIVLTVRADRTRRSASTGGARRPGGRNSRSRTRARRRKPCPGGAAWRR